MSLKNTREKAEFVCKSEDINDKTSGTGLKSWKAHLSSLKDVGFVAKEGVFILEGCYRGFFL